MLLLRTHLLPLLRAVHRLPSSVDRCARLLSTSAAPFSLEEYLVAACGLAPDQARKTAKKAFDGSSRLAKKAFEDLSRSRLNSASNPDAVLALLSGIGLSRADITAVVAKDPLLLRSWAKTLGPRLFALRDRVGLSTPQIVRFLLVSSRALRTADVLPRLEFLISLYGSFEPLPLIIQTNPNILRSDLERVLKPNFALLQQCGLSLPDFAKLWKFNGVLTLNPERFKEIVLRAEELGVPRTSRMFKYALAITSNLNKEKIAARLEFLKTTLGSSESEVATAVSSMPTILGLSEECLLPKIQFLIKKVGLDAHYIVRRPALLAYSLEKRLVPRHCVMKILQEKGLLNSNMGFYTLAKTGEETFKLRYIDCHKDSVPCLAHVYATARAGVVPN